MVCRRQECPNCKAQTLHDDGVCLRCNRRTTGLQLLVLRQENHERSAQILIQHSTDFDLEC